jgi:hypothetical protein
MSRDKVILYKNAEHTQELGISKDNESIIFIIQSDDLSDYVEIEISETLAHDLIQELTKLLNIK